MNWDRGSKCQEMLLAEFLFITDFLFLFSFFLFSSSEKRLWSNNGWFDYWIIEEKKETINIVRNFEELLLGPE